MLRSVTNLTPMARPLPALRKPVAEDGPAVWSLVAACKPLDENSRYCNLIQCDHFADTCVLAELRGKPVGWISGHIPPSAPETLFVWQVAVDQAARGLGLGQRMLDNLLARDTCARIVDLQTTITMENDASWAMFRGFARRRGATLSSAPHFRQDAHFNGAHATEYMVTIRLAEQLRRAA